MRKSVVGLFNDMMRAEAVVRELENAGFARNDISIVAASEEERLRTAGEGQSSGDDTASGALKGAGTGAAIGGGLGLVAGLASLAIPGFGPVIAAGPIASALAGAGIGAAAGGMIGALTHVGVPERDAAYYAEGVRRGGTLVMVRAEEELADRAADIMEEHDAVDVEERAESWREAGWQPGYDESGRTLEAERGLGLGGVPTRDADVRDQTWRATAPGNQVDRATTFGDATSRLDRTDEARDITGAEERFDIGMRQVRKGGVRLYAHAGDNAAEGSMSDRDGGPNVSRRSVDQLATAADMAPTFKDRTGAAQPTNPGRFDDESDYRRDFESRYAGAGYQYDRYAPAYEYGSTLARDQRYTGRDWDAIEPDIRRDWESRGQGAWEDFKDSVRYGWQKMRGR